MVIEAKHSWQLRKQGPFKARLLLAMLFPLILASCGKPGQKKAVITNRRNSEAGQSEQTKAFESEGRRRNCLPLKKMFSTFTLPTFEGVIYLAKLEVGTTEQVRPAERTRSAEQTRSSEPRVRLPIRPTDLATQFNYAVRAGNRPFFEELPMASSEASKISYLLQLPSADFNCQSNDVSALVASGETQIFKLIEKGARTVTLQGADGEIRSYRLFRDSLIITLTKAVEMPTAAGSSPVAHVAQHTYVVSWQGRNTNKLEVSRNYIELLASKNLAGFPADLLRAARQLNQPDNVVRERERVNQTTRNNPNRNNRPPRTDTQRSSRSGEYVPVFRTSYALLVDWLTQNFP